MRRHDFPALPATALAQGDDARPCFSWAAHLSQFPNATYSRKMSSGMAMSNGIELLLRLDQPISKHSERMLADRPGTEVPSLLTHLTWGCTLMASPLVPEAHSVSQYFPR